MYLNTIGKFVHIPFPVCDYDSKQICDLEISQLEKVVWTKIKEDAPHAFYLLRELNFEQIDYADFLIRVKTGKSRGFSISELACKWITEKSHIWERWIHNDNYKDVTLFVGGIFPLSGVYWNQRGVMEAADMAIAAINGNTSVLLKHNLTLLIEDGECAPDKVIRSFISYITSPTYKTMVGVIGPACTDTIEPITDVAKLFNVITISYSAEGPLSDDNQYFFRTIPGNSIFQHVYMALFKKLGYSKVASLTEEGQKYSAYISKLQQSMENSGMDFIINKKFQKFSDMPFLKELKSKLSEYKSKIIIGEFYENAARSIMCNAYHLGMTAANDYIWFLPSWFDSDWFNTEKYKGNAIDGYKQPNCSKKQMIASINGHLSLSFKTYADDNSIMQEGKRVKAWREDYEKKANSKKIPISPFAGYAYDAVWMLAEALKKLIAEDAFFIHTLHSQNTTRRLAVLLNETNMHGVSGHVSFIGNNRCSDVIVFQWINGTKKEIGLFHPESFNSGHLDLNETNIEWLTHNGQKPEDGKKEEFSHCEVEGLKVMLGVSCEVAILISIVFALFILLVIIAGAAVVIYKRRYEKKMKDAENKIKELGLLSDNRPFALDQWELPRDHIIINRKLGEGAFGAVYGGEANVLDTGWISVAVKTLKNGAKPEEKLDFISEAEIMKQFDHINIVKLVGVCTMGEPVYTVMEFMLYGDLKTYLLSRRSLAMDRDHESNDEVSNRRLTHMALDIARGLSYLADKKYVHRDLACRNCLVNSSRSVKIADFGMCRAMYDSDYYRYNKKGFLPVRWMAPESLIDGLFTPMSDVWSYGVVLYEIITFASLPYHGLSNSQTLEYIKSHKTLAVPKGSKNELNLLLIKCWSLYPQERPQACEIVEILATNSELISPCLDMPVSSVATFETETLELGKLDRARGHSFSTIHQIYKNANLVHGESVEPLANDSLLKRSGLKFNKKSLHESYRKKPKKDVRKDKHVDIPQITYL